LFHHKSLHQFEVFHFSDISLNIHGAQNYNTHCNVPLVISDSRNLIQTTNDKISPSLLELIKYLISPFPSTEMSQSLRPQTSYISQTHILHEPLQESIIQVVHKQSRMNEASTIKKSNFNVSLFVSIRKLT
jgi:response regulator of citrate/malate metabolism